MIEIPKAALKGPEWLTLHEAAAYCGLSYATVYKMARAGRFPAYRFGRSLKTTLADVDGWIRSCRVDLVKP